MQSFTVYQAICGCTLSSLQWHCSMGRPTYLGSWEVNLMASCYLLLLREKMTVLKFGYQTGYQDSL